MFRSIKQEIEGEPRDLPVRRAFNALKKKGKVQTILEAVGTLNDANKLTTRYSIEMRKFDVTRASEPRMVWQLGLLYYSLLKNEIWSRLVTTNRVMYTTAITPFEIYDSLEEFNNDVDAKVFHRELFDGSIRTMSALIDFLDPSGDLENMQLTLDDFNPNPNQPQQKCTRYKQVDFDDIVLDDEKLEKIQNGLYLNLLYKDSDDYLIRKDTFNAGSMNMGISLYEAPGDGTQFIIKEIADYSHEATVMKKFAPFDESCNVVGARLFEGEGVSGVVMQPLSGDLQRSFSGPTPKCSEKVARKVCFEIAKSYRCMIERHGLYYFDIKLENVMYSCDTETNAIKLFPGDFGGFTEQHRSTTASHHTLLPYNHFFIYDTQSNEPAVAYPIDELAVVLSRYKYLNRDVEDVNENDFFVAVPDEEKSVLLRVGDGMHEKYLELTQQIVAKNAEDIQPEDEGEGKVLSGDSNSSQCCCMAGKGKIKRRCSRKASTGSKFCTQHKKLINKNGGKCSNNGPSPWC